MLDTSVNDMICDFWLLVLGFVGQGLFACRFLVQWLYSERYQESRIPPSFWYFSFIGGILMLIYAMLRRDVVFIFGQGLGLLIYSRNLFWVFKGTTKNKESCRAP